MRLFHTLTAAGLIAATASRPRSPTFPAPARRFPYPIYTKWADAYKKETGIGLNYQSIGSGGGIKQIQAKTVTFGATDAPLKGEDLDKHGLIQFPTVMGGIVPVVNLDGIKPGELVLDGPTLAKIFLGEIKTWDDAGDQEAQPERQAAEPGDRHRASLGRLGHDLQLRLLPGRGQPGLEDRRSASTPSLQWPVGIGAKGNEGVANNVAQTKGSIGYVEYAYAKQNKLTHTKMINKAGKTVSPTSETLPGRGRQCRLEVAARLRRDPGQPARRRRPGR